MDNNDIRKSIQKIAGQGKQHIVSIPAKVTAVNDNLCDVEPTNGDVEILDVRLQSSNVPGLYIKPVIDSIVYITRMDSDNYFVVMYSEIELIELGGDKYGGLTITPELKDNLDKNNELLQALLNIISGSPIPEPGNGSPSALQTALAGAILGKTLGNFDDIENEKIKHGDFS